MPIITPPRPKRRGEPGTRTVVGVGLVLAVGVFAASATAEPKPQLDRRIRALWVDSFKLGNLESDHELKGYRLKQILKDRRARPMANVWVRPLKIGERTGFQDVRFFTEARGHRLYRVHRVLRLTPRARYRLYLKEARTNLGPPTVEKVTTNRLERLALHIWTTTPNARAGTRLEYRIVWRTKRTGRGVIGILVRTLADGAAWAREYRGGR